MRWLVNYDELVSMTTRLARYNVLIIGAFTVLSTCSQLGHNLIRNLTKLRISCDGSWGGSYGVFRYVHRFCVARSSTCSGILRFIPCDCRKEGIKSLLRVLVARISTLMWKKGGEVVNQSWGSSCDQVVAPEPQPSTCKLRSSWGDRASRRSKLRSTIPHSSPEKTAYEVDSAN